MVRLPVESPAGRWVCRIPKIVWSGRGDKIRTYNFIDSRVVDHRLRKKTKDIKRIMKGELGLLLD